MIVTALGAVASALAHLNEVRRFDEVFADGRLGRIRQLLDAEDVALGVSGPRFLSEWRSSCC